MRAKLCFLISHRLVLIIGAAACLLMLALEGEVVADDAAGLGPVFIVQHCSVGKMTQRRKLLLHVQDVAVRVNALRTIIFSPHSGRPNVSRVVVCARFLSRKEYVYKRCNHGFSARGVSRHQIPTPTEHVALLQ